MLNQIIHYEEINILKPTIQGVHKYGSNFVFVTNKGWFAFEIDTGWEAGDEEIEIVCNKMEDYFDPSVALELGIVNEDEKEQWEKRVKEERKLAEEKREKAERQEYERLRLKFGA